MATAKPLPLVSYANTNIIATKAYQAWLDINEGGFGMLPSGTFLVDAPLSCNAKTAREIKAVQGAHWIKKAPNYPKGEPLFNIYNASFLTIDGIGFDGDEQESWTANSDGNFIFGPQPLVVLIDSHDVKFRNCILKDSLYMLIEMSNCERISFRENIFSSWGRKDQTEEGGAAVWMNGSSNDADPGSCIDVTFDNNLATDGRWSFLYTGGAKRLHVTNNRFVRLQEATIFGSSTSGIFTGNHFVDIKIMTVSPHPFEIGGWYNIIANNIIDSAEGEGIHIVGLWFNVVGNILKDCKGGAVAVFSSNVGIGPEFVQVVGNMVDAKEKAPYAMVLARIGIPETEKINSVIINQNMLHGEWSSGDAIPCLPNDKDVCGKDVIINGSRRSAT